MSAARPAPAAPAASPRRWRVAHHWMLRPCARSSPRASRGWSCWSRCACPHGGVLALVPSPCVRRLSPGERTRRGSAHGRAVPVGHEQDPARRARGFRPTCGAAEGLPCRGQDPGPHIPMLVDDLSSQKIPEPAPDRARVVDLRGLGGSARPHGAVLEDPSGVRRRWLARFAVAVAVLLGAWIVALVLAGLGLFPSGAVPLAPAVARPHADPPPDAGEASPVSSAPGSIRPGADVHRPGARGVAAAPQRPSASPPRDQRRRRSAGDPAGTRPIALTGPRDPSPRAPSPATPRGTEQGAPGVAAPSPAASPDAAATPQTAPSKRADAPGQTRAVSGPDTAPGRVDPAPGRAVAPDGAPAGADPPDPAQRPVKDSVTPGTTAG